MSDALEAGGSSAMRHSLWCCGYGCPCVPAPDKPLSAPVALVPTDDTASRTQPVATVENASVDSIATSTQPFSNSQDNSDSTFQLSIVQLSSETSVTEALQRSIELNDTATTHRVALQEEVNWTQIRLALRICRGYRKQARRYKRQVIVAMVDKSDLMFLVYCLVGVIISLVAAMVLRTN